MGTQKVRGCFLVFVCLVFVHFLSAQVHYLAGLKRDTKFGLKYGTFMPNKLRYLNASKIGSELVSTFSDCALACIKTTSCLSFNLAVSPAGVDGGKAWCELLDTDKYNSSDKFYVSQVFHHYSIETPCSESPCKNEGKCIALYDLAEFRCECPVGFQGIKCDNDVDECSTNVCHSNADCTNTVGSYSCTCKSSYKGDGKTCQLSALECSDYTSLTSADRKTTYGQGHRLCDSNIAPGWYRFQGSAGTRMAMSCVASNHCGTDAPGWLSGNPPTSDDLVDRKACFTWGSNCCNWQTGIKVRKCGDFFVYYLNRAPACALRYCGTD